MVKTKPQEVTTIEIVREKVSGMEAMVNATKVTNEKELEAVSDKIKNVKTLGKFIGQEKDKLVAPAKAIIAEAKAKYDPFINECERAEDALKGKAKVFLLEQDRKRREEENAVAKKLEEGKIKLETANRRFEKIPEQVKSATTETSKLQTVKLKVVTVTDPHLVPDEYWMLDLVLINKIAKAGLEIPGVTVTEDISISSR